MDFSSSLSSRLAIKALVDILFDDARMCSASLFELRDSNHPVILLVSLFQLHHDLDYSLFKLNVNTFLAFLFTKPTNAQKM